MVNNYILGISYGYHDSSAVLLKDGIILAACQEERFSRVKHDSNFPKKAIEFIFQKFNLNSNDLCSIIFYENPIIKFNTILKKCKTSDTKNAEINSLFFNWVNEGKFTIRKKISDELKFPENKIYYLNHHLCHASSAYFCSPFQSATILTIDAVGENETSALFLGKKCKLEKITSIFSPHSLGLFYSALTAWLGFEINEGEYKVMGMAPYGKPKFYQEFLDLFSFDKKFGFKLDQKYFNFEKDSTSLFSEELVKWLGPGRAFNSQMMLEKPNHFADVAASVQKCTETVILRLVQQSLNITKSNNLCLAGGVALNSAANGRIRREINCNLYIQPNAGDAGTSLGACLFHYHIKNRRAWKPLVSVNLGFETSNNEINYTLLKFPKLKSCVFKNDSDFFNKLAELLASGKVLGLFQGKEEWGPRALGFRSILANPSSSKMRDIVNEKIKFRELFRPFAPIILKEFAHEFFEISPGLVEYDPEFFMLTTVKAKQDKISLVPAVVHVDGSSRVQIVSEKSNCFMYELIKKFYEKTGLPCLLNTSFNLKGEPIVNTCQDAINTFLFSDMDFLVIEKVLIHK